VGLGVFIWELQLTLTANMSNLKNVTNRLRTAVGLAPTSISSDDAMTSPANLSQSLLGTASDGAYAPLSTTESGSSSASRGEGGLGYSKQEEERKLEEFRARKLIEEEDRKLAQRLQGDGEEAILMKIQVPQKLYGGQIMRVQLPGLGIKPIQIPLGLKPGDSFMITSSKLENGGSGNLRVKIPDGTRPGETFLVILPSGKKLDVVVPTGSKPGDELLLEPENSRRGARVGTGSIRLSDQEVISAMTEEEKQFLKALPKDMYADVIQEKRFSILQELESGGRDRQRDVPNNSDQSKWVPMVQATIPEGVEAGQQFRMIMPDGKEVMVEVPPGMQPGETIGVPANAGTATKETDSTVNETEPPTSLSEQEMREREEFLAALPDDIRAEVLANEGRANGSQRTTSGSGQKEEPISEQSDSPLIDFSTFGHGETTTVDNDGTNTNSILDFADASAPQMVDFENHDQAEILSSPLQSLDAAGVNSLHGEQSGSSYAVNSSSNTSPAGQSLSSLSQPPPSNKPLPEPVYTFEKRNGVPNPFASINENAGAPSAPAEDAFASLSIKEEFSHPSEASGLNHESEEENQESQKTPLERLREAKAAFEKGEIDQAAFNRIKQDVIKAL